MKMNRMQPRMARRGFTLIEILVAIAIIAILVGLLLAGVMGAFGTGTRAIARTEMKTLETAIGAAQNQLGGDFLPSRLVLREDNNYNVNDPIYGKDYANTMAALDRAFGRRWKSATWIDWNGNGVKDFNAPLVLEGQHCLVFWTGGIPVWDATKTKVTSMLGFSPNPTDPSAAPVANQVRKGPFMAFQNNRLLASGSFVEYLDPFSKGRPYAYFSSGKSGNDYTYNPPPPTGTGTWSAVPTPTTSPVSDCASLQLMPYYTLNSAGGIQWANPKGFQIITAGPDGQWGGGLPANFKLPASGAGADNMGNFQSGPLSSTN